MFRWWVLQPRASVAVLFVLLASSFLAPVGQANLADLATSLTPARSDMAIAFDGVEFVLFGGRDDSTAYDTIARYDPVSGSLSADPVTLPAPRFGMASAQVGNLVYMFGGYDDTATAQDTVWTYDLASGNIATLAAVLPAPAAFSAAAYHGDSIWILGGEASPSDPALDTVLEFDVTSDSFATATQTLVVPVEGGAAAATDDHVYLFGGEDFPASNNGTARIQRLDPATGTVTALSVALPQRRAGMAAYYDAGQDAIVVLGGFDRDAIGAFKTFYDDIHVFDVATETLVAHEDTMPTGRAFLAAADGGGDFAYIFGGLNDGGFLDDVLRFNMVDLAPIASFTADRVRVTSVTPIAFTDTSTDRDGEIVGWSWDFDDGRTSSAQHPSISYPKKGFYNVTLTVTDDDGLRGTYTLPIQVDGSPPTASFTMSPSAVQTDVLVTFKQSSNDLDGTVVAWDWDFGGATASGREVQHAFAEAGPQTVSLTVTDNDGLSTTIANSFDVTPFRDCDQPNKCVSGTQTMSGVVIPYRGDVLFEPSSSFTVNSGTLRFERGPDATEPVDVHRVLIDAGATVRLVDVDLMAQGGVAIDLIVKGDLVLVDSDVSGLANVRVLGSLTVTDSRFRVGGTFSVEGDASLLGSDLHSASTLITGALIGQSSQWHTTAPIFVGGPTSWIGGAITASSDAIRCADSTFTLHADLQTSGAAIQAESCRIVMANAHVTGTGDSGDLVAVSGGALSITGSQLSSPAQRAITAIDVPMVTITSSIANGTRGLGLSGHSTANLVHVGLGGTQGAALDCASLDGVLTARGGAWVGQTSGLLATSCPANIIDTEMFGQAQGASITNPGAPETFKLTNVHFFSAGTGLLLDGALQGNGLKVVAPEGVRALASPRIALSGLDVASGTGCAICVDGGTVALTDSHLAGPSGTAFRVDAGVLDARQVTLGAFSHDAQVGDGVLDTTDVLIAASSSTVSGSGRITAHRSFQPVVQYKNGDPVGAAQVTISNAGTQLAQGTTDALGRGPGVSALMFEQTASGPVQGSPLQVSASRAGLSATTNLHPAGSLAVVLVDNMAPGPVGRLVAGTTDDEGRVPISWAPAVDNHLAPRYRINISVPQGPSIGDVTTVPHEVLTTDALLAEVGLPAPGKFRVHVTAVDLSGNPGPESTIDVVWDGEPPAIALGVTGEGRNGWYRSATVTATATEAIGDLSRLRVTVDGVPISGTSVVLTKGGRHLVEAEAMDTSGNVARRGVAVNIDAEPPTVASLRSPDSYISGKGRLTLFFQGDIADAHSGVQEVRLERRTGGAVVDVVERFHLPMPISIPLDIPGGAHDYVLVVVDKAGNQAESRPLRLVRDDAPPELVSQGAVPGGATFQFSDTLGVSSIVVYDGDRIVASGQGDHITIDRQLLVGRTLRVVATDLAGKTTQIEVVGNNLLGVHEKESPGLGLVAMLSVVMLVGLLRRPPGKPRYSNRFMQGICGCNDGGGPRER